ncbi:alpha/beta-hydrolase [Stipitochalara longipes BDJ]|nr:alpha/beta-hydrolase [Stipitochalara longipes BDJ]
MHFSVLPTAVAVFTGLANSAPTSLSTPCDLEVHTNGGILTGFINSSAPEQENFSEDCLTLNVWTPRQQQKLLPVIVWFFGGGFTQGGTNSLYFNPQSWVQRTQEHVVVTVNFRSNIFGFPNSAGLHDQNLGLLDQRLALEWVRDNIASFGGDPSKIIDWGESAGAIAVDYLDFAYPNDPIVSGRIMASGTALFSPQYRRQTADFAQNNFTTVAEAFGCGNATSHIDCLRKVSWQDIESYLATAETEKFTFIPVADERIVFANYSQRYEMGGISEVPAIVGTNQHELNALAVPGSSVKYSNELDILTNSTFLCTAAASSKLRQGLSRTTYRYRYDGNFSNISPGIFTGAYHGSELPLIFGTAGEYHGGSTDYEGLVGRTLQDFWLAFAKDPKDGLRNLGWGSYEDGSAVLIGGGNGPVEYIEVSQLDMCSNLPSVL